MGKKAAPKRDRLPMVEVSQDVYAQLKIIAKDRGYTLKGLASRLLGDALKRKVA